MPWDTSFTFVIYLSILWVLGPRISAPMLFHHGVYMCSVFSSKRHLLLSKVLHKTISRQAPVQWGLICSFWQISVGSNQISLVSAHLLHLFPFKMCFFSPHRDTNGRWLLLWQSCDQCGQSMYSSPEWTNKQNSVRSLSAAAAVYKSLCTGRNTGGHVHTRSHYCRASVERGKTQD